MPALLLSPLLWQSTAFTDQDAWQDFLFQHDQWHRVLARSFVGGERLPITPLDDLRVNLLQHAVMHEALAKALQVPQARDLRSFDLTERGSWESFMYLNAQDHERLRVAAGL